MARIFRKSRKMKLINHILLLFCFLQINNVSETTSENKGEGLTTSYKT